jgi:elongation factor 1-alpha
MHFHHEPISKAVAGDIVSVLLKGTSISDLKRGYVISSTFDQIMGGPVKDLAVSAIKFVARIVVLNHPGEIDVGYSAIVHCHTAAISCKITRIIDTITKRRV